MGGVPVIGAERVQARRAARETPLTPNDGSPPWGGRGAQPRAGGAMCGLVGCGACECACWGSRFWLGFPSVGSFGLLCRGALGRPALVLFAARPCVPFSFHCRACWLLRGRFRRASAGPILPWCCVPFVVVVSLFVVVLLVAACAAAAGGDVQARYRWAEEPQPREIEALEIAVHCMTRCIGLRCVALRRVALRCIALHCIAPH